MYGANLTTGKSKLFTLHKGVLMNKSLLLSSLLTFCSFITADEAQPTEQHSLVFEYKVLPADMNNKSWEAINSMVTSFLMKRRDMLDDAWDGVKETLSLAEEIFALVTESESDFAGEVQCNLTPESQSEQTGLTIGFEVSQKESETSSAWQEALTLAKELQQKMEDNNGEASIFEIITPYIMQLAKLIMNNKDTLAGKTYINMQEA